MTAVSPTAAAFEGFRVMRREPKAVLSWIAVWGLALAGIAIIKVFTGGAPVAGGVRSETLSLMRGFGPLTAVLAPALLVLWIMTIATVYRAVCRRAEHGWHLFKLGPQEGRLAVITAAGFALAAVFGSAPALVLFVLARPVLAAAPGLGHAIVDIGAAATVALEIWIAVRLSLMAVHTFIEGRFHVGGYWRLTRGRFWRLLASYLLVFVEVVGVLAVLALVAVGVAWATGAIGAPHGIDPWRRGLLICLAAVAAAVSAVLFVIPTLLVCACQAFAYKEITARPWG